MLILSCPHDKIPNSSLHNSFAKQVSKVLLMCDVPQFSCKSIEYSWSQFPAEKVLCSQLIGLAPTMTSFPGCQDTRRRLPLL